MDFIIAMTEKLAGTGFSGRPVPSEYTAKSSHPGTSRSKACGWQSVLAMRNYGVKAVTCRLKIGILMLGNVPWPSRTPTAQDISVT